MSATRTTTASRLWVVYGSPLLLLAACIVTAMALGRGQGEANTDFLTFNQSGRQFLAGGDPYVPFTARRGPNLNPPWVVAAMAPLSRLSLRAGVIAWWAFSFACLFASAALIARTAVPGQAVAVACGVLVTQAGFSNVALGQVAWPLMLLMTAAWRADRMHRRVAAGVLLGLAIAWKPFLLVFVPYLGWRREWRTLIAAAGAITATVLAGLAVVGMGGYRSWIASMRLVYWEEILLNASLRGFLTRVLMPTTLESVHTTPVVVAPSWRTPIWLIVSGVLAAIAAWRVAKSRNVDAPWASLSLLAVLVSPLGWVHYVPIVTGPAIAALRPATHATRLIAAAGWLLLCVPFLWLRDRSFTPLLTATIACAYMWGTLLLLVACLTANRPIDDSYSE
jgi:glycosyl transferase family 87